MPQVAKKKNMTTTKTQNNVFIALALCLPKSRAPKQQSSFTVKERKNEKDKKNCPQQPYFFHSGILYAL